jgi:hypothetical protein
MDLSKSDKKVARDLIDRGVEIELNEGLASFANIIDDWKNGKTEPRDSYHRLYKSVKEFDKHIARRYDAMRASDYFWVVIQLFQEKKIPDSELDRFSPEVQVRIQFVLNELSGDE